jgi:hypothetical protein
MMKRLTLMMISLLFLVLGTMSASAQLAVQSEAKSLMGIEVHFRFDKSYFDINYMGNDVSLDRFAHVVDSIGVHFIDSVVIVSQSSPEGVYEHNISLSRRRAATMRSVIEQRHPDLSSRLRVHPDGESWAQVREYVKNDTRMKQSTIDKVLSIIDDNSISIGTKKWRMEQLPIYRYLLMTYYPRIRNSVFCIVYYSQAIPVVYNPVFAIESKTEDPIPSSIMTVVPLITEVERWEPRWYLKTNAIGLGMAISNAAVEVDLARHWSVALPIYYSAWNYFKTTIKFRTLAIQPELRYWFSGDNAGFFAGAHFGLAYYNFAFDGGYRYQDHAGNTPAIGGGVSIGYRMPISKNERWHMEFALGAGVYANRYDIFHNPPCTKEGLMVESIKKPYWGIDQAAISFAYSFDIEKRGGSR